ncbi:hypothetical protein JRO89_XS14G0074400 [Xanthoceras sorbifolium]|uniref:Uncharacterized protein n=1 Tax=Xanthoceras sorbifolium TaxID=99658 RepID=A0ABQ8H4D0_9ROSI|nr:hypothetical protein JRO89_XS14G0074400 [Xanthoceras sorbifolium]
MIFSTVLRRSASSLAFLASQLARINRHYLTKKHNADESLARVIDSEIKSVLETNNHDRVKGETPSEFPFTIEDNPGQCTALLTREYRGELVKVEAGMPDLVRYPKVYGTQLKITLSKYDGPSLEFICVGTSDEISIKRMSVNNSGNSEDSTIRNAESENCEDELLYKGPHFNDLD